MTKYVIRRLIQAIPVLFGIFPSPAALLGPNGWPNFLPEAISGGTNGVLHADFGVSVDSGEPIPDERLEVHPAAELTVDEERAK